MKKLITAILGIAALSTIGLVAVAGTDPRVPPTPSANLGIEVTVTPVAGSPGLFDVNSVLTDLQTNTVVARPHLQIPSNTRGGRIEMGVEGEWMIDISVAADGASGKATYEATFTRDGKAVSRQKVAVNLGG